MLFADKVLAYIEEFFDLQNLKLRILPRYKECPFSEAVFNFGSWSWPNGRLRWLYTGTITRDSFVRELTLLPFKATLGCIEVRAWFARRRFCRGFGLVSELASVSVSAFSANKVEAGFTIWQAGSGHYFFFLKIKMGLPTHWILPYRLNRIRVWDCWKFITRGNTVAELFHSGVRVSQG